MTTSTVQVGRLGAPNTNPIEVRGLTKRFGATVALDGLDLSLAGGQVVGLLGENGCGKTTLMKILAGVMAGWTGDVRVAGHVPGPEAKAHLAYLPDADYLPGGRPVRHSVDLYDDFFADFDRDKALDLIGYFGLDPHRTPREMSKGMREKLQIALTLARDAQVVLLDEPISGVDPTARDAILSGVMRGLGERSLVLIATHLVHDLEPLLDQVVMMRHGRVLLTGQVDDLRAEHQLSIDHLFRKVYQ